MTPADRDFDWNEIKGGEGEAKWLDDIIAKSKLFDETAKRILDWKAFLTAYHSENLAWDSLVPDLRLIEGLLSPQIIFAHPDVIRKRPDVFRWYYDLAAIADKTRGNLRQCFNGSPCDPKTLEGTAGDPRKCPRSKLIEYCIWINEAVARSMASGELPEVTADMAALRVAMTEGIRVDGTMKNVSGKIPVIDLILIILEDSRMQSRIRRVFDDGKWRGWSPGVEGEDRLNIREIEFDNGARLRFPGGGDKPDIEILSPEGNVLLVGEIKGRKDLANLWESWMPQIEAHLKTWAELYPDAKKIFLGTIITESMIEGTSLSGTRRSGIKDWMREEILDDVYNVSNMQEPGPHRDRFIDNLMGILQIEEDETLRARPQTRTWFSET